MDKLSERRMRVVYGYNDRAGGWFSGCIDATVDDALRIFKRFEGNCASLHVVVDEDLMIGWLMHGSKMYEVQHMNEPGRRKRMGQMLNELAEKYICRVFEGDRDLKDLEENSWFYSAGEWEPKADQDYLLHRSMKPDEPTKGGEV